MPYKLAQFIRLKTVGEGTYGIVYKAKDIRNNESVALKRMYMDESEEGIPSTSIREVALLKQLKSHPNIVDLKGIFFDTEHSGNDLYLVFEYCTSDLKKYMNKCKKIGRTLSIDKIRALLYQILAGISHCHSMSILHRDIKPQNILINEATEQIKITDFGLSRCHILPNRTWTHEIITLWYRPPEILLGCAKYSISVDVWSIACVFAEMLNNSKPLFRGDSEISQLMHIFIKCGSPDPSTNWPSVVRDCKYFNHAKNPKWKRKSIEHFCHRADLKRANGQSLLNDMLVLDPTQRLTPKQALKHSFFKNNKT